MRTQRRAWTPQIPLTLLTTLAVIGTLSGCQQAKDLAEEAKEKVAGEPAAEEPAAEEAPAAEAEPPKSEEAKVELAEAKEAGLPEVAIAPPPVEAKEMTSLDDLLGLVPKDGEDEVLVVVRDASVFINYIDESSKFVTGPLGRLGLAAAGNPELAGMAAEFGGQFPAMKAEYDKAKASIDASGVHLDKGIVLVGGDDLGALIYSGDKPEALSELIKTIDPSAGDDMHCKAIETAKGYVVCMDDEAKLGAYAPVGAEGAAALRSRLASTLPGVDFEQSNIIADVPGEDAHLAIETPPGMMVLSVALPMEADPELAEVGESLSPSSAQLLRAVQPGAGFVWANLSPELVAEEIVADLANDESAPPPLRDLMTQFNGEVLLAGHYNPAAVALQLGLKDDSAWPEVAGVLATALNEAKGEIDKELAIPGGTWDVGMKDIPVGEGTVSAFHAGLTGVPEADVLAQMTGLTVDMWGFAANDALHFALGASPEAIGYIAAAEATHEGASDGLKAYLPPTLTSALEAGQISMVAHVPFDAMHSPQTHELIKTALKNVEEFKPELALALLDFTSVLSSYTMWISHSDGKPQVHIAAQAFGHSANDEGKAALAAAAAVASGADPAEQYGPLVTTYPDSSRIASYKARAGETPAGLVASGFGAIFAAGALAYPVIEGHRNEEIAAELEIEEGAAEKVKEESKKEAESKPQPKPQPKADDKPAEDKPAEPAKDDTKPAEEPATDEKPAEEPAKDDEPAEDKPAAPSGPPPIIPADPKDGGGDDAAAKPGRSRGMK